MTCRRNLDGFDHDGAWSKIRFCEYGAKVDKGIPL